MLCGKCNSNNETLIKIYKDGDDPVFLSNNGGTAGSTRQHLPINLCRSCILGEHVPVFRKSIGTWEIGEITSFREIELQSLFLLRFGFEGNDTEWLHVVSDPFAEYMVECRRFVTGREELKASDIAVAQNDVSTKRIYTVTPIRLLELSPLSYESNTMSIASPLSFQSQTIQEMLEFPSFASNAIQFWDNTSISHQDTKHHFDSNCSIGDSSVATTTKYRRLWTEQEDQFLLKAVQRYLNHVDWQEVSCMITNTTAQQCKNRYEMKVKEWTPMEDAILFQTYYFTCGQKWAFISNHMSGRSETNVKNRFHHIKRRLEKMAAKLDVNKYVGDNDMKQRIIENARDLQVPWDLVTTVVDLLVYSLKEAAPLMSMNYEYIFALIDVTSTVPVACCRCGLIIPSIQTGEKRCSKTGWCQTCTTTPAYLFGNFLRMHHSLRYSYQKLKA